jgi:hypothetical protein
VVEEVVGGKKVRRVLWDPGEGKGYLRRYFDEWMGRGEQLWFEDGGVRHPLFAKTVEGARLRRRVVRARGGEGFMRDLAETIPATCRSVLWWWRRKCVREGGEWRQLREEDHLERGVGQITSEDWELRPRRGPRSC